MADDSNRNRFYLASDAPDDVCGFTTDYSFRGNVTCWRRTNDNERCIWHRDETGKSAANLAENRTEHWERLDGAILRGIGINDNLSFSQCTLDHVDLTNSSMRGTDFSGANLDYADFSDADINWADFSDANIYRGTFCSVDLGGSVFCCAQLDNADFTDAQLEGTDFSDAVASDAIFTNAVLIRPNFTDAKLNHVDFTDAEFETPNFSDANLWRANFTDASLRSADLSYANLTESRLSDIDCQYSDLEGADLTDARASDADLTDATVTDAIARGSHLSKATLENTTLTRTDLREADLSGADFYQTQFADIRINSETDFGDMCSYEMDDESPGIANETPPLKAAIWVYRRLETLHKENALADRAREYHVRKEETQRKSYWKDWNNWDDVDSLRYVFRSWNLPKALIYSVNRWLTRYGESPYRVIGFSLLTVLGLAVLYPFAGIQGDGYARPITWENAIDTSSSAVEIATDLLATFGNSIYFSTVTFTTLGYGDMRPLAWGKGLATVESFLGSLLMALLVFVLGRRATW